jgi:AcrR family transcriptional regulator
VDTPDRSTQGRILAATIEVIARDGWDAVTVRKIASEAGVNFALVNYHFGSKADLKLAALEAAIQDETLTSIDDEPLGAEPMRVLDDLIRSGLQADIQGSRQRVFESALAASARDPEVAARLRPLLGRFRQLLTVLIADAVTAGQMPPTTDAAALAIALAAMFDGMWLQRMVDPDIAGDRIGEAVSSLLRSAH